MEKKKTIMPRIALRIIILMVLACLILDGGIYVIMTLAGGRIQPSADAAAAASGLGAWAQHVYALKEVFWPYIVPASVVFFGLFTLLLWGFIRRAVKRSWPAKPQTQSKAQPVNKAQLEKEARELNQRFYLHLFGVLQREGRLMDFFSEDLSQYQDDQIGAAVRSIQEDCKKTIDKYLAPGPVLEQNEGEQITVAEGFDPNELKLTGNVTGKPPFTAVIRHRGWRAGKLELPTLSGRRKSDLITPAEVEVI